MSDPTLPPDTLLVNGADIRAQTGVVAPPDAFSGCIAPMTRRGTYITVGGSPGQGGAALPLDAFTFIVPLQVVETVGGSVVAQHASAWANYQALIASFAVTATDGRVTLTRRFPTTGGHVDKVAAGAFDGSPNPTWLDNSILSVHLQFTNLDGTWAGDTP